MVNLLSAQPTAKYEFAEAQTFTVSLGIPFGAATSLSGVWTTRSDGERLVVHQSLRIIFILKRNSIFLFNTLCIKLISLDDFHLLNWLETLKHEKLRFYSETLFLPASDNYYRAEDALSDEKTCGDFS